MAAAAALVGLVTLGSGTPQYAAVTAAAWQPIVATYQLSKREIDFLLGRFKEETRSFYNLREAQNFPFYALDASPFSEREIESLEGILAERIKGVHPPFVVTVSASKEILLYEPTKELPKFTYTSAVNGFEILTQYGELELEKGFSNLVYKEPYWSPTPTPTPWERESEEMQAFDLEIRLSIFAPEYFRSLIAEPTTMTSLITELLKCTGHEDVEPDILDLIIAFWKKVCEEIVKALSDPEKLGQAIAEWIAQHPLETGIGFFLWLIRLLRKRLSQADLKAEKALKIVEDLDNVISAIMACLEITKMRLAELSGCTQIPVARLRPLLEYLKEKGFIFQDSARFYSLSLS